MSFFNKLGKKLDDRKYGIIFGILFPIIAFVLLWMIRFSDLTFQQMYNLAANSPDNRNVAIFPILPNLFLFYFSNFRLKWNRFTTGLVAVTIVYATLIAFVILVG
ncbi:MAG: hypothetical protein WC994_02330 [Brumimicrobium sp.]